MTVVVTKLSFRYDKFKPTLIAMWQKLAFEDNTSMVAKSFQRMLELANSNIRFVKIWLLMK